MKTQLDTISRLLSILDPQLYSHLKSIQSLDLFCCYRWMLILFKREFGFADILSLWEFILCDYRTTDIHLFVAVALIKTVKVYVLECASVDDLLRLMLDLRPELGRVMMDTEDLVMQFIDLNLLGELESWNVGEVLDKVLTLQSVNN